VVLSRQGMEKFSFWRWLILVAFSAACISNTVQIITFAAVATDVQRFYHVGPDLADSLTSCNMMVYVVFVFPAAFFLERFGLSVGVITATTLTCLGSWIRIFGGTSDGFHALLVGQIVESIANVVFMNAPAALSAAHFPQNERNLATSIAAMSNAVGSGIGLGVSPMLISSDASSSSSPPPLPDFQRLVSVQAFASTALCLFTLSTFCISSVFGVEGSPKEMDGITMNRRGDMVTEMKACIRSPSFLTLFTAFSLGFGVFNAISTLIGDLMHPTGYTDDQAGLLGTFILVGGVCGSAVIGSYLDRSKRLKETMQRMLTMSIFTIFLLCYVFLSPSHSNIFLSCIGFMAGFFLVPLLPIGLELGAESSYPTSEALSSSLLVLGGQVCGVLLIAGMELLAGSYACKERYSLSPDPAVPCRFPCCLLCLNSTSNDATVLEPARDATSSLALMVGVLVISCCVSWSFRGEYLRMQAEDQLDAELMRDKGLGGRGAAQNIDLTSLLACTS